MTFDESRLIVLMITAPHPSSNALPQTLALVPGGPEPMTNGLGSLSPSTVVARVGMGGSGGCSCAVGFSYPGFSTRGGFRKHGLKTRDTRLRLAKIHVAAHQD